MKKQQSKSAFTMIELVFAIVVIGILAAVAVPRFAATRDDAIITKNRVLIASVRNALAMERQKRVLRGKFKKITAVGDSSNVFGNFWVGNTDTNVSVLEYPMASEPNKKDRWSFNSTTDYYTFKSVLGDVAFKVDNNGKFVCVDDTTEACKSLTK